MSEPDDLRAELHRIVQEIGGLRALLTSEREVARIARPTERPKPREARPVPPTFPGRRPAARAGRAPVRAADALPAPVVSRVSDRPSPLPFATIGRLGAYRVERRLAAGGMGEVFVAHRLGAHGFEKRVALKCVLPQLAEDAEFVSLFIDEARVAARLDHPSIVQVFDFGEIDGTLFLAMEYVSGPSLHLVLRTAAAHHIPVPVECALHVAADTARALAYAHSTTDDRGKQLSLVHRDVSPANLLITPHGGVKLSDFGIVRCSESARRTQAGQVRGKLGYMSPEQITGTQIDGRSDVFTLGAVVAEMLIGRPLFGSGSELDVLLRNRNVDLTALEGASMCPEIRQLLGRMLEPDPDARPDAETLSKELDVHAARDGAHGARKLAALVRALDLSEPLLLSTP